MNWHDLRVAKIVQETPDARSIVLEIPRDLSAMFAYRAGQFLTFEVPHPSGSFSRCYSLSSAPEVDAGHLKVTVKRVAGGKGSNWFNDVPKHGTLLRVQPPAGRFVLKQGDAPLLLFGGGSGITPIISLIKSSLTNASRKLRLFYANRDKASIIFDDELQDLASKYAHFEVIHHLDAEQGLTNPEEILVAMKDFEDAEVYICGPAPFLTMVEHVLANAGTPRKRISVERFEASGDEAPVDLNAEVDVVPSAITLHLEGKAHTITYEKGQTILEAARTAGLLPPSSCQEGFCASCAAKLIKGKVVLVKNDIYTPEDLADNWILTCQGHCYGAEVEITYDTI